MTIGCQHFDFLLEIDLGPKMETDRSDVSDKAEREEREKRGGKRQGGRGGWEGGGEEWHLLPSVLPSFPQQEKRNWPMRRETSEGRVMMGAPKVAGSFLVFYANFFCLFLFQVSPDLQTCNYYLQKWSLQAILQLQNATMVDITYDISSSCDNCQTATCYPSWIYQL